MESIPCLKVQKYLEESCPQHHWGALLCTQLCAHFPPCPYSALSGSHAGNSHQAARGSGAMLNSLIVVSNDQTVVETHCSNCVCLLLLCFPLKMRPLHLFLGGRCVNGWVVSMCLSFLCCIFWVYERGEEIST